MMILMIRIRLMVAMIRIRMMVLADDDICDQDKIFGRNDNDE